MQIQTITAIKIKTHKTNHLFLKLTFETQVSTNLKPNPLLT